MALYFLTYSKKSPSPIYIRYREGSIDAKTRTPLIIDTDRLVKGQVIKHRIKQSDNAEQKAIARAKNNSLDLLQIKMNEIYRTVQDALNTRGSDEVVDKNWIKDILYPKSNSNLLATHIDNFLINKKVQVKENSYKLYSQIKRVIKDYEDHTNQVYEVKDIDLKFNDAFTIWLQDVAGYSNNSVRQHVGGLVQVLKFSKKRGVKVSTDLEFFKDGLKKQKTLNVYLSLEEIQKISELKDLDEGECIARDWLVISCFTAQRSSDMFRFNSKDIDASGEWITVQQTKNDTSAKILVPIMPQVRAILNKYDGEFPPLYPLNNYFRYVKTIKKVCKKAGLDEMVDTLASKRNGTKKNDTIVASEVVSKEKWEVVGSHVGRRSFATNFYGKIPTPLITSITGHLTESSFLLYINRERLIDRKDTMKQLIDATK
tara:strand:- start:88 stop:1371 length:1284 start_codon:yes stop_codon:yes gene_type:complete